MKRGSDRFRKLSEISVDELGLAGSKARGLQLAQAWRRVAGQALARKAKAVGLSRGVLRVEVEDPAWRDEIAALVPELESRLGREYPRLGVRSLRVVARRGAARAESTRETGDTRVGVEASRAETPATKAPTAAPRSAEERLADLATRYLERARNRSK